MIEIGFDNISCIFHVDGNDYQFNNIFIIIVDYLESILLAKLFRLYIIL